jgi:hypothetical protein
LIFILVWAAVFAGCSTHDRVFREEHNDFLKTLDGRKAEVVLSGDRSTVGSDFSIHNDSLFWRSLDDNTSRAAALPEVKAIVTRNRILGGIKGFLLGVAAGTTAIALMAGGGNGNEIEQALTGVVVGGILVIGGTTAGIIIGHPHEYEFVTDSVRVNK